MSCAPERLDLDKTEAQGREESAASAVLLRRGPRQAALEETRWLPAPLSSQLSECWGLKAGECSCSQPSPKLTDLGWGWPHKRYCIPPTLSLSASVSKKCFSNPSPALMPTARWGSLACLTGEPAPSLTGGCSLSCMQIGQVDTAWLGVGATPSLPPKIFHHQSWSPDPPASTTCSSYSSNMYCCWQCKTLFLPSLPLSTLFPFHLTNACRPSSGVASSKKPTS